MSIHSNGTRFNYYSLPSFLDEGAGAIDATQKNIIIEIGEGNFILDYGIMFNDHDIVIKGAGMGKTNLIIDENDGFIDYEDDSIFNFQGDDTSTHFCPISVRIEDLTIQTNISKAETEGNSLSDIAHKTSYLIKCYNVKSLIMHNVEVQASNLITTCLDVRRGKNIDIRGCVFANYNRRWQGGCIWLRGDMKDVNIVDNEIYKYGNDEVIAIWGSNNYWGTNIANTISKKNINICHNRIYCQDINGGEDSSAIIEENPNKWSGCLQRFITLYTNQDDNTVKVNGIPEQRDTPCLYTIEGVHFDNNEIFINAPIDYLFTIALDKFTTHKDISINNNIIKYGTWEKTEKLVDFSINYDTRYNYSQIEGSYNLFSDEPFYINGNTIICSRNSYYTEANNGFNVDDRVCLDINGVVVQFNQNCINYIRAGYEDHEANTPYCGFDLFRTTQKKGGTVIFNENHCEGLKCLINASTSIPNEFIPIIRLIGKGNHLQGNPRIKYKQVNESHVSLIGNELICDYPLFLLSEFANSGTVIFVGNRVYRDMTRVTSYTVPRGQIFYTSHPYADSNITSLHFICCQNAFENLQYTSSMYYDLQCVSTIKAIHENNTFADYIE